MLRLSFLRLHVLVLALSARYAQAQTSDSALAGQAAEVLRTHCVDCHKGPGSQGGRLDATLKAERGKKKPYVVASRTSLCCCASSSPAISHSTQRVN